MKKYLFLLIFFLLFLFAFAIDSRAVTYDLLAPTDALKRGEEATFTINIDTGSATITTAQVGLTYETQYLQYVRTTAGATMTSVAVEDQGGGKLLLTGTNQSGFSGKGIFATITFNLIAEAAGSTQLCALWAPAPAPTTPPTATSTPQPGVPSQTIIPTTIATITATPPRSGSITSTQIGVVLGIVFLTGAAATNFYKGKIKYKKNKKL